MLYITRSLALAFSCSFEIGRWSFLITTTYIHIQFIVSAVVVLYLYHKIFNEHDIAILYIRIMIRCLRLIIF
jgi:hypothetical protein